jgi:D-beta-D-heptose 7-phosphate kinase/D-beta-D-heptose 1-phosphate adenosyltransferase
MQRLARIVRDLESVPILVVGDLILDAYIEGSARRVSPEAPVLVFEKDSERAQLGGACNVAANLVALGSRAAVLGVVGDDSTAGVLRNLLAETGIDDSPCVTDPSRPTTRKSRFVSRTQQVLRVDEERRHPLSGASREAVLANLRVRPFPFRAILLSDYGKGVLDRGVVEEAVAAARSVGGIVVVDPKGTDYSKYRGVDLLTPNREEAEAATGIKIRGHDDLAKVAAEIRRITGVAEVTVTLGKDGIFFETADGTAQILPTQARAVFDVTGAGDTVVAVLTLARANGVGLEDSLAIANAAAGIVVGRFGTWAVSRSELLSMLGAETPGKILDLGEAISTAARLRADGHRLVFTNGCFDILHPGHTDYLSRARSYGDALMVAVNTDASVRRQGKGDGRPINPLADRLDVLAALSAVDFLLPFDSDTPLEIIRSITPHVLVKGEDWRDRGVVGADWVEAHGGQVVLVPLRAGCSTTAIIQRILALPRS